MSKRTLAAFGTLALMEAGLTAGVASAATETVLHSFQGPPDGEAPGAALIADSNGALYGTTMEGGDGVCMIGSTNIGCGTVFKLSPPAAGKTPWIREILHNFKGGTDGEGPGASLAVGPEGVIYGTTRGGGAKDKGTVFMLTPPAPGKTAWGETVLYSFKGGTDGFDPYAALISDPEGSLYGTTVYGGVPGGCSDTGGLGCGTVFRLSVPPTGGSQWTEQVLYSFKGCTDGANPAAALTLDASGALYGTTPFAGGSSCNVNGFGIAFRLSPPKPGKTEWTELILHHFGDLSTGHSPPAALIAGPDGSFYGTASGGGTGNNGVVYQLKPPTLDKGTWPVTILYRFRGGTDGRDPQAALIVDSAGVLYGTTLGGGNGCNDGCGTAYKLTPPAAGQAQWTESVLYTFKNGSDGGYPYAGLTAGTGGVLYGTTSEGGTGKAVGTVYSLTGTGFAP